MTVIRESDQASLVVDKGQLKWKLLIKPLIESNALQNAWKISLGCHRAAAHSDQRGEYRH
jgi:hypothetical protein